MSCPISKDIAFDCTAIKQGGLGSPDIYIINFGDAVDFVGWYCHLSHIRCGIPRDDAYRLYLAYHEGHAGYNQGTWRKKAWLRRVAQSVQQQTRGYGQQLAACESECVKSGGGFLWPF